MKKNKSFIFEGDSRITQVSRIIDKAFSYVPLDRNVHEKEYLITPNKENTYREYIIYTLRHDFGLMQNSDVKYLPLVAKIAFSDEVGFLTPKCNFENVGNLHKILSILKKDDSLFEKIKSIPDLTYSYLFNLFEKELENIRKSEMEGSDDVSGESDYDIVLVDDFEKAKYYGERSCSTSKLCFTQSEGVWDIYTRKGENTAYVCLRHGWENIPEKPTEGNPYDLYGTSMIFVFISPKGELLTSHCRWNHNVVGKYEYDVDHAFTPKTLSQTVGVPFSTFKPEKKEKVTRRNAQKLLDQGRDPKKVFDYCGPFYDENEVTIVRLNNKWNFINKEHKIVFDKWFDWCSGYFNKGLTCVRLNGKFNFINTEGKIISETWFDRCYYFNEGFARVMIDKKWNYIKTNGKLVSPNQWFDWCYDFSHEGFACVGLNDKENFINTEGKIVFKKWFDMVYSSNQGFAVILNGKRYYIDKNMVLYDRNSKVRLNESVKKCINLIERIEEL